MLNIYFYVENCALTEENLMEFLGILEKKGLDIITEYARLLAEVRLLRIALIFDICSAN